MKKGQKILLGCLVGVTALTGAVAIWQWENIDAVIKWRSYSQEELVEQISHQKEEVIDVLQEYGIEKIKDFTFEEEEAIRRGELSVEEAIEKYSDLIEDDVEVVQVEEREGVKEQNVKQTEEIANKSTTNTSNSQDKKNESHQLTTVHEKNQSQEESKQIIEAAVAQMYALKAKYIAALGQLEQSARQEYANLSKKDKEQGGVSSMISRYMGSATSLQGSCDSEVAAVLNTLRKELNSRGESTEIVDTIQATYEQEKSLKKAYYLSLLK